MMARIWHGITNRENADEYLEYISKTGIFDYRRTPGNKAAFVLRRDEGKITHFITFSLWDSIDSIINFAGVDYDKAKYYPNDEKFLLEFEPTVQHYEVDGNSFETIKVTLEN